MRRSPHSKVFTNAVLLMALAACGDGSDPIAPEPQLPEFGTVRVLADHREVDVRFEGGEGAILAGTLFLPPGPPQAVAALNPGSAWTVRTGWDELGPFVLTPLGDWWATVVLP